jgi:phosphatidylglycerol:prolipoprotein diacylglycerol transferase
MFADVAASLLPLGHAIGRIGCYLNGCCYGCEYDGVFSVNFIVNGITKKVFPTWFFESGFCFVMFIIMQMLKKEYFTGFRTGFYLISYSMFRFLIEYMRGDEIRGKIGILSSSQAISIVVLVVGFEIMAYSVKSRKINDLFSSKEHITNGNL